MTEYALDIPEYDQTKPLFLAGNVLDVSVVSESDPSGNIVALRNRFFENSWSSNFAQQTITFTPFAFITASALGIADHNFDGFTQIRVEYSEDSGATWLTAGVFFPAPGYTFLALFPPVTGNFFRVIINAQIGLRIGYLAVGMAVQCERGAYAGVTPAPFALDTAYLVGGNSEGQYTRDRVIRERVGQTVELKNLSAQWVRIYGAPLALALRQKSAFYAWRLAKYRQDVMYGWTEADAEMSHTGPRDLMDWRVQLRGINT